MIGSQSLLRSVSPNAMQGPESPVEDRENDDAGATLSWPARLVNLHGTIQKQAILWCDGDGVAGLVLQEGTAGTGLGSAVHPNLLDRLAGQRRLRSRSRAVAPQPENALAQIPLLPTADRHLAHADGARDRHHPQPIRQQQHDPRPPDPPCAVCSVPETNPSNVARSAADSLMHACVFLHPGRLAHPSQFWESFVGIGTLEPPLESDARRLDFCAFCGAARPLRTMFEPDARHATYRTLCEFFAPPLVAARSSR